MGNMGNSLPVKACLRLAGCCPSALLHVACKWIGHLLKHFTLSKLQ